LAIIFANYWHYATANWHYATANWQTQWPTRLNWKIEYAEAGIKGFDPPQPFKLPANYLTPHVPDEFLYI
jgi:hypothetical protein